MSQTPTVVLLVAAGVALIVQNLVMTGISERSASALVPLVMNSAVGLVVLSSFLAWQTGFAMVRTTLATAPLALLVPGLLGTFFVFASLTGYRNLGAAPTIAVLVTSQLVSGMIVDIFRAGHVQLLPMLGAVLLAAGSCLVLFCRG